MSSSSEEIDRFLWTSASSSSEDSEMSIRDIKENGSAETKKRSKHDNSVNDSTVDTLSDRRDSKKKKKRRKLSVSSQEELKRELKHELVSDCDGAKPERAEAKPKRDRVKPECEGAKPEPDASADDSYLELRVKREKRASNRTSSDHNHTDSSFAAASSTHVDVKQDLDKKFSESDNNDEKTIKKKKKHKKNKKESNYINVEDELFSASETVVLSPPRKRSKRHNDSTNSLHTSVHSNTSDVPRSRHTSPDSCAYETDRETTATRKTTARNTTNSVSIRSDTDSSSDRSRRKSTEGNSARKFQLSERIVFEDEEHAAVHTEKNQEHAQSVKYNLVDKYITREKLRIIVSEIRKYAITQDDDVWLLNSPCEVTSSDLNTRELSVDGKGKIKVDGNTYECSTERDRGHIDLNMCRDGRFLINRIPLKGTLQLRKRIPKPHVTQDGVMLNKQQFIPLPDTKPRHPLLGADYRAALVLPKPVRRRLKEARATGDSVDSTEPEPATEPATVTKAKKRKRKSEVAAAEREDSPPPRKKNKKAKRNVDAGAWDSARAIEENLFNF